MRSVILITGVFVAANLIGGRTTTGDRTADGLLLAKNRTARVPIVVAQDVSESTRQVAAELAEYLGRITGAKFDVTTGDGARGIVLGTLAQFPDPGLKDALAIRDGVDGREAFAIRTEPDRLRLIGATELGASHAAFRFLESLGCRWFFPAPEWTVIADNRTAFDAQPEYLALVKNERRGPQMCVSNPAVRQVAVEWALSQLRRRPELDMVSLETSDGSDHCECESCQKLGSISERAFGLANEAARAIAKEFPGKMVGMYAYNDHCEPPSFPLEPNVYVQSTAGFIRGRYTFDELMKIWPKQCRNMGFYEYFSVWLWDFDMPPGGRGADVRLICQRMQKYAALGATSVDCESGNNWGLHGRGYYVANRLLWNPGTDVDALLADFYGQAFGPAAAVMQRYYERLDPGNDPLLSEHLLGLALRDLDEASRLAKDRPDVLARLDHLKQYQHYVRLRWEHQRAADKPRKQELALQALTHVYRTRYSYMNHWEAIRQSWIDQLVKEFDQPSWWDRGGRQTPPWKIDPSVGRDETEQRFREDLVFFQPQDVVKRTFSTDLVPAGLKSDSPAASRQQYQKGTRYALWSTGGEPLELTIVTGIIAWYRDRPDATYVVTDAIGKEVTRGRLPQDGKEHPLRVEVAAAGLYWFEFNDQAAAWSIRVAAGRPVAVALSRSAPPAHLGHMQRMYFFVPRGTRKIEYYWKGGPHTVHGPDGAVQAEVTASGKFVTVEVPAGSDGQPWSITRLALGHLWFFNVPNYLAAAPDALLVPREVLP